MRKKLQSLAFISFSVVFIGCSNNAPSSSNDLVETTKSKKVNIEDEVKNLDIKKVCSINNGVIKLLDTAEKYNKIAIKKGLEFKRLGMKTSQYINETKKAIKNNQKEITLLDKKGKPTNTKVSIEYASVRACKFAISALKQEIEARTTYKDAIPGDGYKF